MQCQLCSYILISIVFSISIVPVSLKQEISQWSASFKDNWLEANPRTKKDTFILKIWTHKTCITFQLAPYPRARTEKMSQGASQSEYKSRPHCIEGLTPFSLSLHGFHFQVQDLPRDTHFVCTKTIRLHFLFWHWGETSETGKNPSFQHWLEEAFISIFIWMYKVWLQKSNF